MIFGNLRRPWLWLSPQLAHDVGPLALKLYSLFADPTPPAWRSFLWRGLVFKNRVGIAGGVDKNADNLKAWWALGCGFVEIGTVTPLPQEPNPGKITDRHATSRSMWNRMGFPSEGAEEVLANLRAAKPFATPVFVNIGKNRATMNDDAVNDYLALVRELGDVADAFVVNISSPNTKGLRDLQNRQALRELLRPVKLAAGLKPVLLKLAPDLDGESLAEAVTTAADQGIDGFILTNTTLSRLPDMPYPPEGGVSGAPLAELSKRALRTVIETLGERREGKLLVSVGGVMTPDEVFERLSMGADLVQCYSALIYEGPGFFRRVAKHPLAQVRDAVGR